MSGFSLKMLFRLLDNHCTNTESLVLWLQNKRSHCDAEVAGAWRRVAKVFRKDGYNEAIEHLNNLLAHIKWYDIMTLYFKGLSKAETKKSYEMIWSGNLVCPDNIEQINDVIRSQVMSLTDTITKSFDRLNSFIISNYSSREPPPTTVRYKGIIAFCTLHKMNLTWSKAQQRNCFNRNGSSTCNNLIFVRSSSSAFFWQSCEGQAILKSTSISNRVRFRRD